MLKSVLLWVFSIIFTLGIAVYQRITGPTHPMTGTVSFGQRDINYNLLRSHGGDGDAVIKIKVPGDEYDGVLFYKRFKVNEPYVKVPMTLVDGQLQGSLPHQPPAGKLEYRVVLKKDEVKKELTDKPVVIRFKGGVPLYILIPHVILMFLAMLFSTRTGLEVLFRGNFAYPYALTTTLTLLFGGLIFGPLVQLNAFGEFWTGWPFGGDMTDTKTMFTFIFWVFATVKLYKNRRKGQWLWWLP